ncbi:tail fiber domain-containing protein [Ruminiclostridium cellulolyticum]|uniref:Peptidase S74 domain-containing protein n=1 Tax=Ruminiclostridium cellulolyticum (strain ATCC 35319 / DSM 5812 / JCM 6584 / H10) TaxID=394503 RepID=B8I241_RUMCH|nr:tail fiber domain-containing protein [Ruminiclostridium cellulolyticum]ACL75867.1 hypothetical protein Ccel_1515 [Ruminiclostridium cellulolyticum H10]
MGKELKRMRYFDGLFLNAEDYKLDQDYQKRIQQLHNRYLHTWGIIAGLTVVPSENCSVKVQEGIAINEVVADNGESTSQYIYIYDEHPDSIIDLSQYRANDESIYIYVSYDEVEQDKENLEKGKGEAIHIWERGRIWHSTEKPADEKKYIILARVEIGLAKDSSQDTNLLIINEDGSEDSTQSESKKVISLISYFDDEEEKIPLRRYAGPAGEVLSLQKIIFKLNDDVAGMPFIRALEEDKKKGIGLEVNSTFANFTGSVNIKGDLEVHGSLTNMGAVENELEVSNTFVQVNSKSDDGLWKLQDGGLEVYRDYAGDKSLDARIVWSEMDKCWKMGYEGQLWEIAYGPVWEKLIKNDIVDELHRHSKISFEGGVALESDDKGNLSAYGNLNMNDKTIWLRDSGNVNHGLGWYGIGKPFAGLNVDGPVLFGKKGGILGTTDGGQKPVITWNNLGNVGIGESNPKDDTMQVNGTMRILSNSNPLRFTSSWSGFPDSISNGAEICNDTVYHKALMIVGNRSAGQGRKVAVWDRLEVNGFLYVNGNMQLNQALTPSAGKEKNNGIVFPSDPGGGAGDSAWIRYYPRSGEACTLEIGTSNDADDSISLMASGNVGIGTVNPNDKLDVSGYTRLLSGSNPIRFTSSWSGFPDFAENQAEICNDTTNFKSLMIVGNKSGKQGRKVSIWDRLEVNGTLNVSGDVQTQCAIIPSIGYSESNGIMFPKDYYGGTGDSAWIRYYSDQSRGGGENMTLEIGIANDVGTGGYYGGGDRIKLTASGGVYVDGYFYYSSSKDLKENITTLTTKKAKQILDGMNPVTFNFKGDNEKTTLGFIAEEMPGSVAANDQKAISPMEIIAVLTSVVKEQREAITQLQQQITTLAD